jgi:hypothetical protein
MSPQRNPRSPARASAVGRVLPLVLLGLGAAQPAVAQSTSLTHQTGVGNVAETVQTGAGNLAATIQSGMQNVAAIAQAGQNNAAAIVQSGSGLTDSISQSGSYQSEMSFQADTRLGGVRSGASTLSNGMMSITLRYQTH